jgi:hypothetical protein
VNPFVLDDLHRFLAVSGQQGVEAARLEDATQRLAEVAIVVGDQQRWRAYDHEVTFSRRVKEN